MQKPSGRKEEPLIISAWRASLNLSTRQSYISCTEEPTSGCNGYGEREEGTISDCARGETAMKLNRNILLDLKEVIFLCPHNICLTSSWCRKRGEEHHYDICRYQHQWSHRYDKTPKPNCTTVFGHCFAILAALAGLVHSPWLHVCNPAPLIP